MAASAYAGTSVWNGSAGNGNLSDGGNWDGGAAPVAGDTLDFSGISSATTLNADFGDGREFSTLLVGSGNLTLNGTLNLTALTNAYTLGVASGATLAISGDLVGYAARNTKPLLRSNEGTVTVGGTVRFRSSGTSKGESTVSQYASANANSTPIIANGLAYHADSWSDYLVANLGSMSSGPGKWVVGAGGTSYPSSRSIGHSGFRVTGQDVTLYSSANWTLAESYRHTGNDLYIRNAGKVTVDTSDYYDNAVPRAVTFAGFINEDSTLATALVVKGCGTLVLNTAVQSGKNNVVNHGFAVTETATLQINKGKSITGSGTVSLASGTKLLLPDVSSTAELPSFAPAADSSIVVTNLTAGTPAISLAGALTLPAGDGKVALKIGGSTELAEGIYTVISSTNALPADIVDHLTLDASEVFSGDCSLYAKGGALFLLVGISEPGYGIWVGGTDTNLATAANWLNDETPRAGDTLNFKTVTTPVTLNGDFGDDRVFATAVFGNGVVTLTGNLHLSSLQNAYTFAIASGATLTIDNDLVGYAANNTKPLLYSNEGTVTVGGTVRFRSSGTSRGDSFVSQYASANANSAPIIANGLAYHADSWSDYLQANLGSMGNGPGKWVIGAGGFTIPSSRDINRSGFRAMGSQSVTLHSSANWTLNESYRHYGNDLYILDTSDVTIDTTDWNDGVTPRIVTLKGYINATSTHATPLTITGCGTVVLNQTAHGSLSNRVNSVLAVTNGATLQVNAGKSIAGTGTVSLAAGTTLALPANGDGSFTAPDIIPVTLPAEGMATIRIDGETELKGGDYLLLNSVPAGYADHLTVTGTAIGDRKAKLKDDGEHLILSVPHKGTVISIR